MHIHVRYVQLHLKTKRFPAVCKNSKKAVKTIFSLYTLKNLELVRKLKNEIAFVNFRHDF